MSKKISVIGAGAWGTALGLAAYRAGSKVTLWSVDKESMDSIKKKNINPFLPDIKIPSDIVATDDLAVALKTDIILMVVPAQVLTAICVKISDMKLASSVPIVLCSKGIEDGSLRLMSEIIEEYLPNNPVAVISGPTFADEVANGLPTAATLACRDEKLGKYLIDAMASKSFRLYYSYDVIGAQLGGAIKNVIAIACGISDGLGYGQNTKVALVSRGIVELIRLCRAKGGKEKTLLGLCGIGDMMLTCGSPKSRNMSFGHSLGAGAKLKDLLASGKTVEGYQSSKSASQLAARLGVKMPICDAVKSVLHDGVSVKDVVESLISRPFTVELE